MIYNRALTTNEVDVVYADSSIACVNPDVNATAQNTSVSISISNAARPTVVSIKDGDGGILQSDTITSGSGTGNVSFTNLAPNTFLLLHGNECGWMFFNFIFHYNKQSNRCEYTFFEYTSNVISKPCK
jgi:hypothetical protein